jgi:1-acyl-sn-glycerol-3-phosphate acyltransferase
VTRVAYGVSKVVVGGLLRLLFGLRVAGAANVPASGPVVLAANHASFLDPLIVGVGTRRRCCFLARDSLARVPLVGRWMRAVGTLFIARGAPRLEVFEQLLAVLDQGGVVTVFPEGTRSRDGRIAAFKRGVLLLARRSGAAVVAVGIRGSHAALPPGRWLPRPRRCRVEFGPPMAAAEVLAAGGLEELRRRVAALAGSALAGGTAPGGGGSPAGGAAAAAPASPARESPARSPESTAEIEARGAASPAVESRRLE